jgi:hypothetical protein
VDEPVDHGGDHVVAEDLPAARRRRGRHSPFEPEAANLFFQLVSNRLRTASLIVTSNKPSLLRS